MATLWTTSPVGEKMTEQVIEKEENANPYNMKKEWHNQEDKPFVNADDTLFFDNSVEEQATIEDDTPADKPKRTNYKKRYDDLKKHYDSKVAEFKQREQELLAEAREVAPEYKAPKSVEELESFKKKYPDLYETVETVAHMRSEQQIADIRQEMLNIKKREADITRKEAETALKARHPDFEEIRNDENFHAWVKEQPNELQSWVYKNSNNADLASRAIDLYKLENGIPQSKTSQPRKKASSAADMVSTKTKSVDTREPKIWTEREIARMSMDQFDKYEDEINQAISEGRVIK